MGSTLDTGWGWIKLGQFAGSDGRSDAQAMSSLKGPCTQM